MLFDLMFDPNETHNLAAQPHTGEDLEQTRRRLQQWMAAMKDVL